MYLEQISVESVSRVAGARTRLDHDPGRVSFVAKGAVPIRRNSDRIVSCIRQRSPI